PLLWHDENAAAHFDLRPDTEAWKHAEAERLQEDLRLLYVALTRARHLCWLGVACLKNGNGKASELHKSAIGYVLAGGQPIEPAELRARVDQLAQGQGAIHVAELPEQADTQRYRPQDHAIQPRDARRCTLPPHTPWWIASYSALAQHDEAMPNTAPETPAQSTLAEATQADDTVESAPATQGIHAFPRGAAPGTFLHELLEHCAEEGFARAAAPSPLLLETIARRCQAHDWKRWIAPLSAWLPTLLRTPLRLPDGDAVPLAALREPQRYRAELEFWFEANHVQAQALDRLVTTHTLPARRAPRSRPSWSTACSRASSTSCSNTRAAGTWPTTSRTGWAATPAPTPRRRCASRCCRVATTCSTRSTRWPCIASSRPACPVTTTRATWAACSTSTCAAWTAPATACTSNGCRSRWSMRWTSCLPREASAMPLEALLDRALEQQRLRPLDVAFARFLAERDALAPPVLLWLAAVLSRQLADGHLCLDLDLLPALAKEQDWPADWRALADDLRANGPPASPLLAASHAGEPDHAPLVLDGTRLYLRRYWRH